MIQSLPSGSRHYVSNHLKTDTLDHRRILACGPGRRLQHAIVQCDIEIRGRQRVCAARCSQCGANGSADKDCCAVPERMEVRTRQASDDEQPNMGTDRVASCGSFNSIGFEFRQSPLGVALTYDYFPEFNLRGSF